MSDAVLEWFDSHCHLQDEYLDASVPDGSAGAVHATPLNAALARASEAGVTRLVCVGTGARSSEEAVALARRLRHPGSTARAEGIEAWATVGLHPHDASDGVDAAAAVLDDALRTDAEADAEGTVAVVAVGECGLDYHYDHSPRDVQRAAFAAQVELAHRHGLALVIHTREAWDDTFDVLASAGVPERTVFHCFTGGPAEARRCLDLGASLSFSGIVTFKTRRRRPGSGAALPTRSLAGGDRLALPHSRSPPGLGQRAGPRPAGRLGRGPGQGGVGRGGGRIVDPLGSGRVQPVTSSTRAVHR